MIRKDVFMMGHVARKSTSGAVEVSCEISEVIFSNGVDERSSYKREVFRPNVADRAARVMRI